MSITVVVETCRVGCATVDANAGNAVVASVDTFSTFVVLVMAVGVVAVVIVPSVDCFSVAVALLVVDARAVGVVDSAATELAPDAGGGVVAVIVVVASTLWLRWNRLYQ